MISDSVELQLIQRASTGDAAALECLLVKYRGDLLKFIHRHLPSDVHRLAEPEDVLQDIYFEAFRSIGSFRATDPRAAVRWLVTMARNRIVDLVRSQRAGKRGGQTDGAPDLDPADRPLVLLLRDLAIYERTPSRSAVAHELLAALQRATQRLEADQQQAVRLRYMEQMSPDDIARQMNRTRAAVDMLCRRALGALRTDMRTMSNFL